MKRFLITTSDESTWRRDRPVLFLGEWCRLYNRRAAWEGLDAEVVPYHWDDRQQFDADYERLHRACEMLLPSAAAALNDYHGTAHSLHFWRMVLGPWLYHFVHTVFDRWMVVARASERYDVEETLVYDLPAAEMIAVDLADFAGTRVQDVIWNHHVFGRVIQYAKRIPWVQFSRPDEVSLQGPRVRPAARRIVRAALRRGFASCLALFSRSDEAMVIRSHLPLLMDFRLQVALGQVPKLWDPPQVPAVPPDMSRRRDLRVAIESTDEFLRFAASMIPEQLPTVYLEGFENLKQTVEGLPWPSRPRVIFTSNLYHFCEPFQVWAAVKTEEGYPFVIGQHGGFVGLSKRHPANDHQLRCCDRYLSWGWQNKTAQILPTAILTNIGKPMATWNPSGNLLLVTSPMMLFAFRCMSWPVGPNQSASFVGDQIRFARALDEPIRAMLTVRIDEATDRSKATGYVSRWKDALPGVRIDPSKNAIDRPIRRCRLIVQTYNSGGFLETLARNIPTVMFWNPVYFELRPDARLFLDSLIEARIYHETPESAAQHVTEVWHDVAGWWNEPAVQRARRTFCERYALMPKNPLSAIRDALLDPFVGSHNAQVAPSKCL